MISKAQLRNPTPQDRERLLERAEMVRRTRALEERIRQNARNDASQDEQTSPEPATTTTSSNGAKIAPLPTNA